MNRETFFIFSLDINGGSWSNSWILKFLVTMDLNEETGADYAKTILSKGCITSLHYLFITILRTVFLVLLRPSSPFGTSILQYMVIKTC